MASLVDSIPHIVRTAKDPRQQGLYDVTLSRIEQINPRIRLLRLALPQDGPPFRHLPGQWLDVHIPSIPEAGGFTITSPPSTTSNTSDSSTPEDSDDPQPYIELAVQSSPNNPPAAFFWRPEHEILNSKLTIRVGGRFVYPPPDLTFEECRSISRAVFVAGGVGINPIMSMLSAMHGLGGGKVGGMPSCVRIMYTTRRHGEGDKALFYDRIRSVAERYVCSREIDLKFLYFETGVGTNTGDDTVTGNIEHFSRRMNQEDLLRSLGPEHERNDTVVCICGPPDMTDEFVDMLRSAPGMDEKRVTCEKWW